MSPLLDFHLQRITDCVSWKTRQGEKRWEIRSLALTTQWPLHHPAFKQILPCKHIWWSKIFGSRVPLTNHCSLMAITAFATKLTGFRGVSSLWQKVPCMDGCVLIWESGIGFMRVKLASCNKIFISISKMQKMCLCDPLGRKQKRTSTHLNVFFCIIPCSCHRQTKDEMLQKWCSAHHLITITNLQCWTWRQPFEPQTQATLWACPPMPARKERDEKLSISVSVLWMQMGLFSPSLHSYPGPWELSPMGCDHLLDSQKTQAKPMYRKILPCLLTRESSKIQFSNSPL